MQLALMFTAIMAVFSGSGLAAPSEPPVDACLMICYQQKPNCTEPSYPQQSGDCWTCCTPGIINP